MTEEQKAAYVIGQAACAYIEAKAMEVENKQREVEGNSPAYGGQSFLLLLEKYCIGHNDVLRLFHD